MTRSGRGSPLSGPLHQSIENPGFAAVNATPEYEYLCEVTNRLCDIQWCSRNSKSHFARNLLAIRRTILTLIVRLRAKSDLLIEQYCY